ncbi:MAG: hypothetical protein H6R16_2852 [Proteobacteria bacterium]|nr:hypothetical protein [Pseudomonadota bacterium]
MTIDPIRRNNVTVTGNLTAEKTIVFVHGLGTDQRAWQELVSSLMADFRIVLLDNVGAGESDPGAFSQHRYLNLTRYATDLFEVCEALKLRDVILVGHSVGGMICVLLATNHPALVSRVVLIGASPRYLNDETYRGGFTMNDVNAIYDSVTSNAKSWADSFAPAMMGNPDRPELAAHFAESLKSIPSERTLTVLCSILQSDYRKEVGNLLKPTLIIQTRNDSAVPLEVAEYLRMKIQGSQLKVIDADGHLPHISAPAKVFEALTPFIYE